MTPRPRPQGAILSEAEGKNRKEIVKSIVINLICGAAIGAGAILPGISGGVLCVIFGAYTPLMELLSNPIKGMKKSWRMFVCIAIGWLVGFFVFANLIKLLFGASQIYATWMFIGMIGGSFPALYKEAGSKGRNKYSFIAAAVGFVIMFSLLAGISLLPGINITPGIPWYIFAGVMWGLSIIIPGMTSASLMMSLGFYEEFNAGLASFNLQVIIPWVVGMVVTALLLAKSINKLFKNYYSICFHAVMGIVLASTLVIFPIFITGQGNYSLVGMELIQYTFKSGLISFAFAASGFLAAFFSNNLRVIE